MISLSKTEIESDEILAVNKVFESGWLVHGENAERFEAEIADYLGVNHAVVVSSGTAALHLSLIALGVSSGDEIIVPDFTFPATANVVALCDAKPVFADIDIETFNIDTRDIENKITKNTKGIIPVHQFGLTANIEEIKNIAEKRSLFVLEDAACALGAKFNGKYCGSFGEAGCFSFHPRKIITTGEGGAVATNDREIAEKIKILRNHGLRKNKGNARFVYNGFNYRMTDFQAALGSAQLKKLDFFIEQRRALAGIYFDILKENERLFLPKSFGEESHIYQTFFVLLKDEIDRNKVIKKMRERGIETNYGANALSLLESFDRFTNGRSSVNSVKAFRRGIALPMYPSLKKEEVEFVCENLLESIRES